MVTQIVSDKTQTTKKPKNKELMEFDYNAMEKIMGAPFSYFETLGKVFDNAGKKHIFIPSKNPDTKVLGVAHLDSVQSGFHFLITTSPESEKTWVLSPVLDDRLGVFVLLDVLPKLGIDFDILLTDEEERNASTAKDFKTDKKYNWMFQFDRAGDDVVHYMYGTEFLKSRLTRAGFTGISHGMASDICKLEHLGCCGFNVGTGYEDYHSFWAKADLNSLSSQIRIFKAFYDKFHRLEFKYKKSAPITTPAYYTYPSYPNYSAPPVNFQKFPGWQPKDASAKPAEDDQERCIWCRCILGHALGQTPVSSRLENVCKACAPSFNECGICGFYYHRSTFPKDDKGKQSDICESCTAASKGGADIVTAHTCIDCDAPLLLSEVRNGRICKWCADYSAGRYGLM